MELPDNSQYGKNCIFTGIVTVLTGIHKTAIMIFTVSTK